MLMVANVMEMLQMVITEIIEIPLPQLIPMWQHALLGNYRQQEVKRYSGKISFNMDFFCPAYKVGGGGEIENFNFVWLIEDNYPAKAPRRNNRPL